MSEYYQRRMLPDATRLERPDLDIAGVRVSPEIAQRLALGLAILVLCWGVLRIASFVRSALAGDGAAASGTTQTLANNPASAASNLTLAGRLGVAGAGSLGTTPAAATPDTASLGIAGAEDLVLTQGPIVVGPATAFAALQVVTPTVQPAVQVLPPAVEAPAAAVPAPAATALPLTNESSFDQAWKAKDWPKVITAGDALLKATPRDSALKDKLFSAHFNYGVQLVRSEKLAEAVAEFDSALEIKPTNARALGERKYAQLYLEGSTALAKRDYAAAITPLRTIYMGNTAYRAVKTRLYEAYVGYAAKLAKSGKHDDACFNYQKASTIDAQGIEAKAGVDQCKGVSAAPAGTVKKIEVDIAKQQVTVWENGKALWKFTVSTGEKPYLTRTGTFKILDKMPNAYSSALKWGMPYWMGIYYAGAFENGFHALARVDGGVMPDSVLGKPKTHGCIMLSDSDAKKLYNWAEIGTIVTIH